MKTPKRDPAHSSLTHSARRRGRALSLKFAGPSAPAYSELERRRKALEQRLENLGPAAKDNRGYRTVRSLLGRSYIRDSLAARAALLEAADFMIKVLEMMPMV